MDDEVSVVEVLKVLAHPVRIRIVHELFKSESQGASNPLRVGELTKRLGTPQPIVSQQLKILKSAKVVISQRNAKSVSYSICDKSARALVELISPRLAHDLFMEAAKADASGAGWSNENGYKPAPPSSGASGHLVVDADSCVQNHPCLPMDFCPEKALSQIGFKAPNIDISLCTLCGKCIPLCPYGAFKIEGE